MTLWNRIKIALGAEICEYCGTANVTQRGFEETNHRHECRVCGKETVVLRV
jgi:hypothetical protein